MKELSIRNGFPASQALYPAAAAANLMYWIYWKNIKLGLWKAKMACCDDPTELPKMDRRELIRLQEQYGDLVRDLVTEDPEKVILKLLNNSSAYLTELAALRAHHASVRLKAIELLEKSSQSVLEQIVIKEPGSEFGLAAKIRLERLEPR